MKKLSLIIFLFLLVFYLVNMNTLSAQNRPFPQQMDWAGCIKPNNITQAQMNADIISFYETWKSDFLKPTNMPGGYYIYGDCTGCTVPSKGTSEGHGYGMLITALMAGYDSNAKTYYDGLYNFFDQHRSINNNELVGWNIAVDERQNAFGSATDGDMDVAYSLLLAHHQWGSSGAINYLQEAIDMITDGLKVSDFSTTTNRVLLGDWGAGIYDTRSSDWMTAEIRAYYDHTGDSFWNDANNEIYSIIDHISTNYSASTGLMPDFVVGATPQPAPENFLGEFKETDEFNWNACRFPWRISMDYGHYGRVEAKNAVDKITTWLKTATGNNPANIKAGYFLNGTAMQTYSSLAFTAPMMAACVTNSSNQNYLNLGWNVIKNAEGSYFGDCISLLSMLYISGNWWVPEENTVPCFETNLGPDQSLCGVGTINLNSGIATDGVKTFLWEKDGNPQVGPNTTANTLSVSSGGVYKVTVDSAGVCTTTDEIVISTSLPSPDLGADIDLCSPSSVTLDAAVSGSGINYSWKKDNVLITGESSQTLTNVNSAGTYEVTVSASGCGTETDAIIVTSSLPTGVNDTICSAGTANLSVTGGVGPFNWYSSLSDPNVLTTGSTYNPSISSTTSYYVSGGGGVSGQVGARSSNSGSGWWEQPNAYAYQIQFDALEEFTLDYVKVYASGAQTATLTIYESDNSTVVGSVVLNLVDGENRVPVGITVPAGTDYRMDATGTGLVWLDDNATYPYTTAGVVTVHTFITPWGSEDWYWAFYSWEMSVGSECDRVEVTAAIDPAHSSCVVTCTDPVSATISPNGPINQCGGSVLLTATASATAPGGGFEYEFFDQNGSVQGPGTSNTYSVSQSGNYYVIITDPADNSSCQRTSAVVSISIDESPSSIDLGNNQTICATSHSISGLEPTVGNLIWSVESGAGIFSNSNTLNTTISNIAIGTNVFRATVSNGSCTDVYDEITIVRDENPSVALAGSDFNVCSSSSSLNATSPNVGTGLWELVSGCGTLLDDQDSNSPISGLCNGDNTFRWTVTNGVCISSSDAITITKDLEPSSIDLGSNQTICADQYSVSGSEPTIGTLVWSVQSGSGNFGSSNTLNTPITNIGIGTNVFRATVSNGSCTDMYDEITIDRDENPSVANAGTDISVCSSSASFSAVTPVVGSGMWTRISGCGTISNTGSQTSDVVGLCDGDNVFRWTVSNGVCASASDEVTITKTSMAPVSVVLSADQSQVCEGTQVTITATGNNGGTNPTFEWFENSNSVQGPNSSNTYTFTPSFTTSVHVVFASNLGCATNNPAQSNTYTIAVDDQPSTADAGENQTICSSTTSLSATNAVVGTGVWTVISGSATVIDDSDPATDITGISDNVSLEWTVSNGVCPSSTDVVNITHDCPTGLKNDNSEGLKVYPNPFESELVIETATPAQLGIFDISGKLIYEGQIEYGVNTLEFEQLKSGVYLLQIVTEDDTRSMKLVRN